MCISASGLLGDRRHVGRVAVADLDHGDAGEEVQVLVAVGVPQPRALAAHELDLVARVRRHDVVALERLQVRERHSDSAPWKIFVPVPPIVNSSSSRECGSRPSTMCAASTPCSTASTQAASFGRMPPVTDSSCAAHGLRPRLRDLRLRVARVGQPAGRVGQEDELVGTELLGDGARGVVGVHVVRVARQVAADRSDHRDVVLGDPPEQVAVDALDLPDEAEVAAAHRQLLADLEEVAVVARQADRRLAVAVQAADDVLVLLADQDHLRDLDGLGVGYAQALDELDLHPQALHVARDRRAAAVDDDRVHPDVLEEHDVLGEVLAQLLVDHRRAAVLDDDRLAVELPDVGQSFEECLDVAHQGPLRSCTPR